MALSLGFLALALLSLLGGLYLKGAGGAQLARQGATPGADAPGTDAPGAELPRLPIPTKASRLAPPVASGAEQGQSSVSYRPNSLPKTGHPMPKPRYLVFVIDDAGYSMKELEAFLRLPFPLTIAVLPGLPNSELAAKAIISAGKELILHQPMEAIGGQDPGPGALRLGMGREEVEAVVEKNLDSLPGVIGINNHMGSAVTPDLGIMEAVADVAKKRGIYYLDSRTTSETAIPLAASREGIRYWERDVFLDNTPDRASITRAALDGKKRSGQDRPAVMIGHVWSAELAQALTDLYPQLIAEGFSLSTISHFMVEEASEDDESPGN